MGDLIYADPAVDVRPASAFVDFLAALANRTAPGVARFVEAEGALADGEAVIDRAVEALARSVANERATAASGGQVDWDYQIERLDLCEAEAARDVVRIRKLVGRILALTDDDRSAGRRARALARRQEEAVARLVEALRDARWQMMALRAQYDPTARVGPIFDDPEELRRHLDDR